MLVDGQLVNTETRQKLFFSVHCCTVCVQELKMNEIHSNDTALKLLGKRLRKRISHNTLSVLEKRIAFESAKAGAKQPFRTWVGYDEIVSAQQHKSKGEFFILSIRASSGKNYYEGYKCKNKEETNKILGYIAQARNDSEYTIRSLDAIDTVPIADDDRVRSMAVLEFQTSQDSIEHDSPSPELVVIKEPKVKTVRRTPSPPSPPSPIIHTGYDVDDLPDAWRIRSDPIKGARKSPNGSIYMYSQVFPATNNGYDEPHYRGRNSHGY